MTAVRHRSVGSRAWALAAIPMVISIMGCAATPSPPASGAQPTETPPVGSSGPTGTAGGGCAVVEQSGILRSNTLIDMTISSDGLSDRITFQLGEPAPEPTGSTGRLRAVEPPFAEGGSGLPVEVEGSRFVELRLEGMLLADENGNAMYLGETSVKPEMLALRQVEMTESFEGVYIFVIGYNGNGCVTLVDDAVARTLTLTIGR